MIHINWTRFSKTQCKLVICPNCSCKDYNNPKRRCLCEFQEWYGWHITCLKCGESWQDGEMLPRPFCRGWREERIINAKKRLKTARLQNQASAQQPQQSICPKCENRGVLGMNIGNDGHTEYCDCVTGKQLAVRRTLLRAN